MFLKVGGSFHMKTRKSSSREMGGDEQESVSKAQLDEEEFVPISPVSKPTPEIKPEDLRLRHRIGRGPFGDVWIGTLHSHRDEFDEHHEVAVKVLPCVGRDASQRFSRQIMDIFQASQEPWAGSSSVSWPLGFSLKDSKVSVITKLYESSVADKMARGPDNCIPLADVLRYGKDLAQGILQLHSRDILALNLKPSNFLLDTQDRAVLGDFGMPFLLMDSISKTSPLLWLGTPNYMAPEQWDAKVRGPITFQSDSWGFACSLVEMITGTKPWNHLRAGDIFQAVVVRRERPPVPSALPAALQKVLKSCFEYDSRKRPTMSEIECALSSPQIMFKEADWISVTQKWGVRIGVVNKVKSPESIVVQHCDKPEELVEYTGLSKCSLWSPFQVGDRVRLRKPTSVSWSQEIATVTEVDNDRATFVLGFEESEATFLADPAQLELVCEGIAAGEWVRLRDDWPSSTTRAPSRTGIVHGISESRDVVKVAFFGLPTIWEGSPRSLTKVESVPGVGQFVRLRTEVVEPRSEWPMKGNQSWETGRIYSILPNGGLVVDFPGRLLHRKCYFADVEEVEVVNFNDCNGIIEKYQHLQAIHWAIAPALYLLGVLAAIRVGGFVVSGSGGKRKKHPSATNGSTTVKLPSPEPLQEYRNEGRIVPPGATNPVWLPPAVANMIFKE